MCMPECGIQSLCLSFATCRKVTMATQKQLARLWHTTNIYMYPPIHEYAEKLTSLFPDPLKVNCFWLELGLVKRVFVYKKYLFNNWGPWYLYRENLYGEYKLSVREHEGPQGLFFRPSCRQAQYPQFLFCLFSPPSCHCEEALPA